jgi:hypothetical protein
VGVEGAFAAPSYLVHSSHHAVSVKGPGCLFIEDVCYERPVLPYLWHDTELNDPVLARSYGLLAGEMVVESEAEEVQIGCPQTLLLAPFSHKMPQTMPKI